MSPDKYIVLLVVAGIVALSDAQIVRPATCQTTTGYSGFCVNIYNCPPLIRLLTRVPLSQADAQYLRNNRCGTDGRDPMVCCVPETSAVGPVE